MYGDDNITLGNTVVANGYIDLNANWDGDGTGDMWAKNTIDSTGGKIDISASDTTIKLDNNVTAYDDILLRNNTVVAAGKTLDAGDDVVLAGGKTLQGLGELTVIAGDDIILGVTDVDNHWQNPSAGSSGAVSANGNLILTAGDDIWAHGTLSTDTDSGGNITATAVDDIHLYETGISANADGTLSLTADNDSAGGGDLTVDGDLYGNMYLSGYNVTANGDITSNGPLDVDADNNIIFNGDLVTAVGLITLDALDGKIDSDADITATGLGSDIIMYAYDEIDIDADIIANRDIIMTGDAEEAGI